MDKTLKILMIIPGMPLELDKVRGGVVSAVNNLLKGFSALPETRVRLLSFNKEIKKDRCEQIHPNVDVYWAAEGPFPFHSMNYITKGPFILRKQLREFDPDIIHFQAGNTMNFIRFGVRTRAKMVVSIHGIIKQEFKRKKKLMDKIAWGFNAYLQDKTFPPNAIHLSKFSLNLFGHLIKNNTLIPNAITQVFFDVPTKNSMENKLLYMGVIDHNKNIMYLLRQMKELADRGKPYTVEVLGDFIVDEYKQEVMQYIHENDLSTAVRFHGWVPQKTVLDFIANTDVLVVSSQHESLPMVIAESMAAGKVVAASAVGGIPEMIQDKVDGFLFNLSGNNELADILADLHSNTDKIRSISEKARQSATERYQCERVAAKTVAFYRTCQ